MEKPTYDDKIHGRFGRWVMLNRARLAWVIFGGFILHIALYAFWSLVGGRDFANQQVLQWLPEIVIFDFGGAALALVYLAWYKIPKEIHDEQEDAIKKLETELEKAKTQISLLRPRSSPLKLEERPPKQVGSPKDYRYASVDVKNDSDLHVENCFLKLEGVIDLQSGIPRMEHDNRRFNWGAGHSTTVPPTPVKRPIQIPARDKGICDFAETHTHENTKARLTFWQGFQDLEPGRYELKIGVFGDWDGSSTYGVHYFILHYEGGNDISLEKKSPV